MGQEKREKVFFGEGVYHKAQGKDTLNSFYWTYDQFRATMHGHINADDEDATYKPREMIPEYVTLFLFRTAVKLVSLGFNNCNLAYLKGPCVCGAGLAGNGILGLYSGEGSGEPNVGMRHSHQEENA